MLRLGVSVVRLGLGLG